MVKTIDYKRFTQKLKDLIKPENRIKLIVIIGALGVLLILLSEFIPKKQEQTASTKGMAVMSDIEYIQYIEGRLKKMVEGIDGAGISEVVLTLESSAELIYAKEEKTTEDKTKDSTNSGEERTQERTGNEYKLIVVDTGSGKKEALISTTVQPKIKGVVVVCEGGGSIVVKERIISAVTTVLDVNTTKVCVLPK